MKSQWSDVDAQDYLDRYREVGPDQALRVYTSRLLGRDPSLVLHGGGNTSVKTTLPDLLGRRLEVICVKGSGWDMAEIEPAGIPAIALEPLREALALNQLSDEAMVNLCRRNLLDSSAPNPSVETLLHAFLPHKFIDHTHACAVLALANQPQPLEVCQQVWGTRMGYVPYVMPGFQLAKSAYEVFMAAPEVEGLILLNHGIFTFGDSAKQAYERMIEKVSEAEAFVARSRKSFALAPEPAAEVRQARAATCLPILRGCLNRHPAACQTLVLQRRSSAAIEAFLNREDLGDLACRGPITPDHIIRTKQKPLILEASADGAAFRQQVETRLDAYIADYEAYFQRQCQERQLQRTQIQPLPVVILVRGLGLVSAAPSWAAASIAADLYEHSIATIVQAEDLGRYQPLAECDLFDMEYWSLEQAKLGKQKARELEGKVTLISGACGGIGEATAAYFAARGSNLVLTDLAEEPLQALARRLAKTYKIGTVGVVADLTDEAQVTAVVACGALTFGGLDLVISNAGYAPSGPIHQASEALAESLKLNLMSHQYLASAACCQMLASATPACLLFNASKSAFNPGPGFGAYSVPKAALIALMKQYAVEFAAQGIRANAVNPDRIRTGLFDENLLAARAAARGLAPDAYFRANLMEVEVSAEDVARAFYHLYTSAKTTACVLTVDGGNIAAAPR